MPNEMAERRKEILDMALAAHSLATVAATKIEQHERTCADRYGALQKTITDLTKMLWSFLGTSILLLVSTVGFLIFYIITSHHVGQNVAGVAF